MHEHEIDVSVVAPERSLYATVHKPKSLGPEKGPDRRQRRLGESPLDQADLLSRLLSGQLGPAVVAAMHRTVRPSLAYAL